MGSARVLRVLASACVVATLVSFLLPGAAAAQEPPAGGAPVADATSEAPDPASEPGDLSSAGASGAAAASQGRASAAPSGAARSAPRERSNALARAQTSSPAVTLAASRAAVSYGRSTVLFGTVSPLVADQPVFIRDATGATKATALPDDRGVYSLRYRPRQNVRLQAEWSGALSQIVPLWVSPTLRASLGKVRLFDRARVWGSLRPAHPGESVRVELRRAGRVVARRWVRLSGGRRYSTRFYVRKPGTYRASVSFDDADHRAARAKTRSRKTRLPYLGPGSRNAYVRLLERRLRDLQYHLPGVDRRYDARTADALRAFNKVRGRPRLGTVDRSTWRALAAASRPRPRTRRPGYHIEVDQTKQVLYVVSGGRVASTLHVSTGRNGATHDGSYRFYREIRGYSGGGLYYPSYFHGLRATHGWPEVPTYPASHGCVRVPMWAARWLNSRIRIGDRMIIYH